MLGREPTRIQLIRDSDLTELEAARSDFIRKKKVEQLKQ
jgi:hypothetical protein